MRRNSPVREQPLTMYLALRGKGVFSIYGWWGAEWHLLNEGLTSKRIYGMATIDNTVFVGNK